jgi:hypothetical protein
MFKKWVTLLAPLVLAPLCSLLTPAIARADYSYWTNWRSCEFSWHDNTPWRVLIAVRTSDNAAHITRIQFGNGNSENIRQLQFWETKIVNGQSATYSRQTYAFSPAITSWDHSITTTLISTQGNRYANIWFYNNDTRTCQDRIEF